MKQKTPQKLESFFALARC